MTRKVLVARPLNSTLPLPGCRDRRGAPLDAGMAVFFLDAILTGKVMPNLDWSPNLAWVLCRHRLLIAWYEPSITREEAHYRFRCYTSGPND